MPPSESLFSARPSRLFWGWAIIFLLCTAAFDHIDNTNGHSRYALLCAMSEDRSFSIDNYREMTVDWSRTPGGRYFSNKAPGPALVAFPVFWIVDRIATWGNDTRIERDKIRLMNRHRVLKLLSFLFQAVPYAIFAVLWLGFLARTGTNWGGLGITAGALFFGNTSTLFMSTYFGHGLAAAVVLGAMYRGTIGSSFWAGVLAGFGVLSDYSLALWIIPFLWFVYRQSGKSGLGKAIAGGMPILAIFAFYHWSCFGAPWTLPNKFQNPEFVETGKYMLWGIASPLPSLGVLFELLFGLSRGILFTQPWVLVAAVSVFVFYRRPKSSERDLGWVAVASLVCLLWFNASFNGWHGGNTPGPRYLSAVFPLFALTLGIVWKLASQRWRKVVAAALLPSLLLYALVQAQGLWSPPHEPLWRFYLQGVLMHPTTTLWLRLWTCLPLVLFVAFSHLGDDFRWRSVD